MRLRARAGGAVTHDSSPLLKTAFVLWTPVLFSEASLSLWILPVTLTQSGLVWSYNLAGLISLSCPCSWVSPIWAHAVQTGLSLLQSVLHPWPRSGPDRLPQNCSLVLASYLGWWNDSKAPNVATWSWSKFPNHLIHKKLPLLDRLVFGVEFDATSTIRSENILQFLIIFQILWSSTHCWQERYLHSRINW